MSLTLLSQNSCNFSGCGLNFANLYDLIAHIEFAHIPLIEEEQRQKVNQGGEEARLATAAPNLPLSFFQRVFPTPYRPNPYPVQPVKVSFNHYRKRVPSGGNVVPNSGQGGNTPNYMATPRRDDEDSNSGVGEDLEECSPNDPELRFRCNVIDCGKRYKNSTALKLHMSSVHGVVPPVVPQMVPAPVSDPPPAAVPAIHLQPPSVSSPTKYAASRPHKCPQCSKRYKTVQGMQNHVQQAHQKLPPMGEDQPSPAALAQLIMQKTPGHVMQSNVDRSNQNQQSQQRAPPLPVSVASQSPQHQQQYGERGGPVNVQHTHLPVRSIHVQQNRMVQQGHNNITTGQMLQQQLLQQRRAQQQQQQHQQAQQGMQQHQQVQQQNNYMQGHPQQQQQHHQMHVQNGPVPQQHHQPPHRPIVQHQMMMQQQQAPSPQQGPPPQQLQQHQPQHQMQQMAPPPQQRQEMDMRYTHQPMNGQMGAGVESSYVVPPAVEQVSQ